MGRPGWWMNGQRVCVEKSMMLLTRGIGRGIIKKEGKISLKSCYFPDFATLHYGGGNSERTDASTRCRPSSEIHQVSILLGERSGHFKLFPKENKCLIPRNDGDPDETAERAYPR